MTNQTVCRRLGGIRLPFASGGPLGGKNKSSRQRDIGVLGIVSIHMSAADGKGNVKIALIRKTATPIFTPSISW